MVDRDLIISKTSNINKHIERINKKRGIGLKSFLKDIDSQDIILFNLQMAIQNCIDIAAHIISDDELGVPGSTNEMFYLLEENGYLDREISEKIVKAVGFRNLIVHEYGKIDLKQVYEITRHNIDDLNEFVRSIFKKVGISPTHK